VLLLAGCGPAADPWVPLVGTWEYRQANIAATGGLDAEGERLELFAADGPRGRYFGLEREGEHGLYYTATEVSRLALDEAGTLTFTVPARTLYRRRPASLEDAAALDTAGDRAGFTRETLSFAGRIEDGALVLYCAADGPACPERVMRFTRPGP
jgi:hypothetical protein